MTEENYNKAGAIKSQIREFERLSSILGECRGIEFILNSTSERYTNGDFENRNNKKCFNFIREELSKLAEAKISELKKEFEEL